MTHEEDTAKSVQFQFFAVSVRAESGESKWYHMDVLRIQMCMLDEIYAKREEIYAIARAYKAEKFWVFGSCARKGLA